MPVHNGYHLASNRLLKSKLCQLVYQTFVHVQANMTHAISLFTFGSAMFVSLPGEHVSLTFFAEAERGFCSRRIF